MTDIFLDIETVPVEETFKSFLDDAMDNFKAPSDMTKGKACADMGVVGDDAKFMSKADALSKWADMFKESKVEEVARDNWKKTSFDGGKGKICSIAWGVDADNIESVTDKGFSVAEMLDILRESLRSHHLVRFVGHNIPFDLKFLHHQSVIYDVKPAHRFDFSGRHNKDFFCNSLEWEGFGKRISQKNLAEILGFKGKPDDIDGSQVYDYYKAGRIDEIEEYNRFDVETVIKIFNKLNFK